MREACNVAVVFPSQSSVNSSLSSCPDYTQHDLQSTGRTIFTVNYATNVRVAITTGHSATLEGDLAMFCDREACVVLLYPALFTEMLQLTRGSAHRLEICKYATTHASSPFYDDNVANLVAGLFQSAAPECVGTLLSPDYFALFPSSWVNSPVQVDGLVSAATSPLVFDQFKSLSVYHVAVCTGKAEKMAGNSLQAFLDVNDRHVCNFIRVAAMAILKEFERSGSIERAIHLAADISVPKAMIYSRDDVRKRMLPIPKTTLALDKNQRIVEEFFLQHVPCLDRLTDVKRFAIELIGEQALVEAERNIGEACVCTKELICQIYLKWKGKAGRDIDFVPLLRVCEKLGLGELKDRCEMFVTEHSFCFKLHPLNCCTCFVEE